MTARARRLAGAAACALVLVVAYLGAVRTRSGQIVENAAMDGRPIRTWWLTDPGADRLALLAGVVAGAGAVALVVWVARRGPRARTAAVVTAVAGSVAVAEVLKLGVGDRPRLASIGNQHYLVDNTFPSGHTALATAVAACAVLVAPPPRRGLVAVAGTAYAGAVGVAVLVAELHRPADAVAASLLAAGLTLAVISVRPGAWDQARAPAAAVRAARPGRIVVALAAVGGAAVAAARLPALARSAADAGLAGPEFARARGVGAAAQVAAVAVAVLVVWWLAPAPGPRTSDRGRTVRRPDGAGAPAPYVGHRADEGSARCADQLSSPVPAGDSGERSPSGWPPTAGT